MNDINPFEVVARFQQHIPVAVDGIARALGLAIQYVALGPYAGQIIRDSRKGGQSGYLIRVNSNDHPNRQRFTLAHEVAHFILHRELIEDGIIDDTMYRSTLSSFYESQANRLAADILMPIMKVKADKQRGASVAELAKKYKVSLSAMKIRYDGIRV